MTEPAARILSADFRVPASAYAGARARKAVSRWVLPLVIFLLATVVAGFFDSRLWILGFMFLMIAYTVVVWLVWLKLMDRHGMQWALRPQKWTVDTSAGCIYIDFMPLETPEDEEPVPDNSIVLSRKNVHSFSQGSSFHSIRLHKNPLDIQFLLVPADAFPDIRVFEFLE
ncbi:MAG: hypothetical protein K2I69_04315 [Muribaculaceae bacterium]|nr:hypothetical protein [Muribaculaceae bacterium]